MKISLQSEVLVVKTDSTVLNTRWVKDFVSEFTPNSIFMPKSVMVFYDDKQRDKKKFFFKKICQEYQDGSSIKSFLFRSLMRYIQYPIKLESKNTQNLKFNVNIYLDVFTKDKIKIYMYKDNKWIISNLRSKLDPHIITYDDRSLLLNISKSSALSKLERVLKKKDIMQYKISYRFDDYLLRHINNSFYSYIFDNKYNDYTDKTCESYYVLGCKLGDGLDTIKKQYRLLANKYHPDKVFSKDNNTIQRYTNKFQNIIKAYKFLLKCF